MTDVTALKKFKSMCLSSDSDYAASLVDKAISAYKNKSSGDRLADPLDELIKQSENETNECDEEEEDNSSEVIKTTQ